MRLRLKCKNAVKSRFVLIKVNITSLSCGRVENVIQISDKPVYELVVKTINNILKICTRLCYVCGIGLLTITRMNQLDPNIKLNTKYTVVCDL